MGKQTWKAGNMLYPLPAVMISCVRGKETPNIITVAWTGTICTDPPMVYISVKPERYSYDIIKESREFVINLTTEKLVKAVDFCGVRSGRDVDKFREMHLNADEAEKVSAPLIRECPVNVECRVKEIEKLGSHHMFIAEVLAVHVDEDYMGDRGKFELNKTGLLAYSHGEYMGLGKKMGKFGFSVKGRLAKLNKTKKPLSEKSSSGRSSSNRSASYKSGSDKSETGRTSYKSSSDKPATGRTSYKSSSDKPATGRGAYKSSLDKPATGRSSYKSSTDKPSSGRSSSNKSANRKFTVKKFSK